MINTPLFKKLIILLSGGVLLFLALQSKYSLLPHNVKRWVPQSSSPLSPSLQQPQEAEGKQMPQTSNPSHKTTQAEEQKILLLKEILSNRNDNDQRLDSEFTNMSDALKEKLIQTYHSLSREKRNERGTIAFLLARDAHQLKDLDFFNEVFEEEACLSLSDCSKSESSLNEKRENHNAVSESLLFYPALISLHTLAKNKNESLQKEIQNKIESQTKSKHNRISDEAKKIIFKN